MKHLITGVTGFVASNLARKLLEAGHHVTGIDNMSCGYFSNIADLIGHKSGFHFEEGDVINKMKRENVDEIPVDDDVSP